MAFSGNFMCTSFKKELLQGTHNFTASSGNTFKLALYTNSAAFNAATTAYTSSNEVSNSGSSYSAGGGTLTNVTPTSSGTTGLTDFADLAFTSATITARGALIYNDSAAVIQQLQCWTWCRQNFDYWYIYYSVPNSGRFERYYSNRLKNKGVALWP